MRRFTGDDARISPEWRPLLGASSPRRVWLQFELAGEKLTGSCPHENETETASLRVPDSHALQGATVSEKASENRGATGGSRNLPKRHFGQAQSEPEFRLETQLSLESSIQSSTPRKQSRNDRKDAA